MKQERQKKDHNIPYMFVDIGHYGNTCLRLTLQNMHHRNVGDELQSSYDTPSSRMYSAQHAFYTVQCGHFLPKSSTVHLVELGFVENGNIWPVYCIRREEEKRSQLSSDLHANSHTVEQNGSFILVTHFILVIELLT